MLEQPESYKFLKSTYQPKLPFKAGFHRKGSCWVGTKIEPGRDNIDKERKDQNKNGEGERSHYIFKHFTKTTGEGTL